LETIESLVDVGDGPRDIVMVVGVSSKGGPFWVGGVAVDRGAVCRGGGGNGFDGIPGGFLDKYDVRTVLFCF